MISEQDKKAEESAIKFKKLFGTEEGKEVLDLLFSQFVASGTYSEDPYLMYFREGQRDVVRFIMNQVDIDLEKQRKQYEDYTNDF